MVEAAQKADMLVPVIYDALYYMQRHNASIDDACVYGLSEWSIPIK